MIRYFHFLVEFDVHESSWVYRCDVRLRPLLLLSNSFLLLFHRKVEGGVWCDCANKLNRHGVSCLQVEIVLECHCDCFVYRLLDHSFLSDPHRAIIECKEIIFKLN